MSFIKKFKEAFSPQPIDERQVVVKQTASWKAFLVLAVAYVAIGIFYDIKQLTMPWSTQTIFMLAFITYVITTFQHEGYSFFIPGVPESKDTLNMSQGARFVPWGIFWVSLISGFIAAITTPVNLVHSHLMTWPVAITVSLLIIIISLLYNWYIAYRIKLGSKFWTYLYLIGGYLSILLYLGYFATKIISWLKPELLYVPGIAEPFPSGADSPPAFTELFSFIYIVTMTVFTTKFRKEISETGKKLQSLIEGPKVNVQRIINFLIVLIGYFIINVTLLPIIFMFTDNQSPSIIILILLVLGIIIIIFAGIREFMITRKCISDYRKKIEIG